MSDEVTRPRIADLFCGAGGAAMGLHRAGFEVIGFDIAKQPRYPFEFHQADALEIDLAGFDAVWASPPCQAYSIMHNLPWLAGINHPELIPATRDLVAASGLPYIIENVMGAVWKGALEGGWLCGEMFGLPFQRHRAFEANWLWLAPRHVKHAPTLGAASANEPREGDAFGNAGAWQSWKNRREAQGDVLTGVRFRPGYEHVEFSMPTIKGGPLRCWQDNAAANGRGVGHAAGWRLAAEAMGIDWMSQRELTQAIPPAYAEHLGRQLMMHLGHSKAGRCKSGS